VKDIFDNKDTDKALFNFKIANNFIDLFAFELMGVKSEALLEYEKVSPLPLTGLIPSDKKAKLHSFFCHFMEWFCKKFDKLTKSMREH